MKHYFLQGNQSMQFWHKTGKLLLSFSMKNIVESVVEILWYRIKNYTRSHSSAQHYNLAINLTVERDKLSSMLSVLHLIFKPVAKYEGRYIFQMCLPNVNLLFLLTFIGRLYFMWVANLC